MSVRFHITPSFWADRSRWIAKVVNRAEEYLNMLDAASTHNLFARDVVSKLLEQVLVAQGVPQEEISTHRPIILLKANSFMSCNIGLSVSGANRVDDFAQADPLGSTVYFQGGWVAEAERSFDEATPSKIYMRHLALGVIKLIHEFAHCLTSKILAAAYDLQLTVFSSGRSVKALVATPPSMGQMFVKKGQPRKGDMGFAVEEVIFRGYRVYAEFDDDGTVWAIKKLFAYKYDIGTSSFVPYSILGEETLVNAIADCSITADWSHFHIECASLKTKAVKRRLSFGDDEMRVLKVSSSAVHHHESEEDEAEEQSDGCRDDGEASEELEQLFTFSPMFGAPHGCRVAVRKS